jgi:ribosomal protein S6 kinase alpha-5
VKAVIQFVGTFHRTCSLFFNYKKFRRCRNRRTQEEFAVKILSLRQEVDAQNEIELLRLCQGHANIVKLHEVYSDEVDPFF